MVRKLAAAMLGVGVLIPGLANALGLGEIKLNSALSEPLDAEIELVQVRELTATEILPSLASPNDFAAANVERFHFLTDLKFEVVVKPNGKSVIQVRSRKPVKEPFVNFLVEVNWPAGRLLREYTLLLDPPIYSKQPVENVSAPKASAAAAPSNTKSSAPDSAVTQSTSYSSGEYAQGGQADTYTVGSQDSLWSIAQNMRPSGDVSIQQTMIAIQRKNPDAFIDGNINMLRKGSVLRAPSEAEVASLSHQDAVALAAEQNRQWRQRTPGTAQPTEARQIDLSGRTADSVSAGGADAGTDRLKLMSAGAVGTGSGQGGTGESGELRNQLAAAEENIDRFKLENEELRSRMVDLEDQLDTSERVLTLKDEQIAALQAKLREIEAAQEAAQSLPEPVPAPSASEAVVEEPKAEEVVDQTVAEVAPAELLEPEAVGEESVDYNFQQEVSEQEASMADASEISNLDTESGMETMGASPESAGEADANLEPAVEAEQETVTSEATPAPVSQPASEQAGDDIISQLINNPMYLAAGGGAIVLLIVLGLVAARRRQAADLEEEELAEEFDLIEPPEEDEIAELDSVNLEDDEAFVDAVEATAEEETVPQTTDVIGEADIYIAYGRFPQAIEMLEKAAESEPDRGDIRLKLCEVCAEAKEPGVFKTHFQALQDIGSAEELSKAQTLHSKLGLDSAPDVSGEEPSQFDEATALDQADDLDLSDSNEESFNFDELDAVSEESGDLASELEPESDTGLDFDLGDLEDTGTSFAEQALDETASPSSEVAGLDFDLNLNLDDSDEDVVEKPVEDEASSLDFDLDASFEAPVEETKPAAEEPSDEVSLDFDSEFSLDSLESEAKDNVVSGSEDEAGLDFDLDFDSSTTELDDTPALDFSELEQEDRSQPEDESVLDSQSAADLASELDLDLDSDFLDSPMESPVEEPVAEVPVAEEPLVDEVSDEQLSMMESEESLPDLTPPVAAPPSSAANDMGDSGDDLDFLSDADEASTKLDLARAYIDMGDRDGAKDILDEVMIEGNDNQKTEAKDLLTRLES